MNVPVDLTSFTVEVFNVSAPTTVVLPVYTMTMVDMKGHVTKTSGNEQTNGEINIAMTAVEGGKTKFNKQTLKCANIIQGKFCRRHVLIGRD